MVIHVEVEVRSNAAASDSSAGQLGMRDDSGGGGGRGGIATADSDDDDDGGDEAGGGRCKLAHQARSGSFRFLEAAGCSEYRVGVRAVPV